MTPLKHSHVLSSSSLSVSFSTHKSHELFYDAVVVLSTSGNVTELECVGKKDERESMFQAMREKLFDFNSPNQIDNCKNCTIKYFSYSTNSIMKHRANRHFCFCFLAFKHIRIVGLILIHKMMMNSIDFCCLPWLNLTRNVMLNVDHSRLCRATWNTSETFNVVRMLSVKWEDIFSFLCFSSSKTFSVQRYEIRQFHSTSQPL